MRRKRIIYHNDARHYYLFVFEPPISLEDAWTPVDEVAGTAVDTFAYGIQRGDGLFYPSDVAVQFGSDMEPFELAAYWRTWHNMKSLEERGFDPLQLLIDRAHDKGMDFFATVRLSSYGGMDPNDNSGVFRFVRSEYAGFRETTEIEPNSWGFHGIGSGTTIDYIQAHWGKDDGIEFFGGSADANHMVITGANDDSAPDDNSSDDENSANLGFDESASDSAKECAADVGKGVVEDTFETVVATLVGGYIGGPSVAAGAAAVSIVDDAADAAKKSDACRATVEAAANNETFVQATHTYFAVGN